jgi:membrane protein implicated in regulation of membrane protease activity
MTWANFYLFCFLVGFLWSLLSLIMGHLDFGFHFGHGDIGASHDLGLGHGHDVHIGHGHDVHAGHGHASHAGGGGEDATMAERLSVARISPVNLGTIAAFLAWFGGAGYIFTKCSAIWFILSLILSIVSGLAGAAIIYWFLAKVLIRKDQDLNPADYCMTGVLGRVSSSIREGGTGEIIYSQQGTRRTCGARSEDGKAIPKEVEVLVTRYQKGIAYVRRWDELSQAEAPSFPENQQSAESARSK